MAWLLKTYRRKIFEIIEMGLSGNKAAGLFDGFMVVLIVLNVASVLLETEPGIARIYSHELIAFEAFSLTIFWIEYLLRFWVSVEYRATPDQKGKWLFRLRFMTSPLMIIDFLAIAPSMLFMAGFDFRLLRIFRLLRLFKLMRYSPALASLGSVLYLERRALFATLVIMLGLSAFAATIMYNLERHAQPEVFGTIPDSLWWALSTLTTVGYGDVVPVTGAGRFFGAIVMIFGVGMYALPIGIIASGFANEIHQRDFVIRWGLVASVPLFKGLDANLIQTISKHLHSSVQENKHLVAMKGQRADSMYLIVSGKVIRKNEAGKIILEEGGFFGAKSLMEQQEYTANYITASKCHFFVLDAREFHHLLNENPSLKERIEQSYRDLPHDDFGQAPAPQK